MNHPTIRQRLVSLAGKAVLGQIPRQIQRPQPDADPAPTVDAILSARQTVENFAARLAEITQARDTFDAATARFRASRHLDYASLVKAGEPLPAVEDFEVEARRAEARLNALATLANREVEQASTAIHTLRRAARHNVESAEKIARENVRHMLPAGMFDEGDADAVIERARPVKQAASAIEELDKLASAGIPIRKAEMFGLSLPRFRTCALPTSGMPGIEHHDDFIPASVIADINRVLAIHLRTIGFFAGMNSEPLAARWS
jgi:hypothetical protein